MRGSFTSSLPSGCCSCGWTLFISWPACIRVEGRAGQHGRVRHPPEYRLHLIVVEHGEQGLCVGFGRARDVMCSWRGHLLFVICDTLFSHLNMDFT